ncbi:hypothetical protein AMAG_07237 [Allomyces macrogynus ATCC 38327]|uniref:Uncharacterized protein n=1 Tax=Allomyces macrogynus (strain ATCC 38327) TaxID=578462 RepID=A0A0L0SHQ3_ALLM3|nr:hypothetical protein AMAG_07237 [Allomyces macrogynus ATCC 38327]|eukprot:KNE61972.1 hypothetical protein AMAG_07237 [Allomyces macrogynus ATCC 38327]
MLGRTEPTSLGSMSAFHGDRDMPPQRQGYASKSVASNSSHTPSYLGTVRGGGSRRTSIASGGYASSSGTSAAAAFLDMQVVPVPTQQQLDPARRDEIERLRQLHGEGQHHRASVARFDDDYEHEHGQYTQQLMQQQHHQAAASNSPYQDFDQLVQHSQQQLQQQHHSQLPPSDSGVQVGRAAHLCTMDRLLMHPAFEAAKSLLRAVPFAGIFVHMVDTLTRWRLLNLERQQHDGSDPIELGTRGLPGSISAMHLGIGNVQRAAALAKRAHEVTAVLLATIELLPPRDRREDHPRLRIFRDRVTEIMLLQRSIASFSVSLGDTNEAATGGKKRSGKTASLMTAFRADHHARILDALSVTLDALERDIQTQLAVHTATAAVVADAKLNAIAGYLQKLCDQMTAGGSGGGQGGAQNEQLITLLSSLIPSVQADRELQHEEIQRQVQLAMMPGFLHDPRVHPNVRKLWWHFRWTATSIELDTLVRNLGDFFVAELAETAGDDAVAASSQAVAIKGPKGYESVRSSRYMNETVRSTFNPLESMMGGGASSASTKKAGSMSGKRDPLLLLWNHFLQTIAAPKDARASRRGIPRQPLWFIEDLQLDGAMSPLALSETLGSANVSLGDYVLWKLFGWMHLAIRLEHRIYTHTPTPPGSEATGGKTPTSSRRMKNNVFVLLGRHHLDRFLQCMQLVMNALRKRYRYSQSLHHRIISTYMRIYAAQRLPGASSSRSGRGLDAGRRGSDAAMDAMMPKSLVSFSERFEDLLVFLEETTEFLDTIQQSAIVKVHPHQARTGGVAAKPMQFITPEAIAMFEAQIKSLQVRLVACAGEIGLDLPSWTADELNHLESLDAPNQLTLNLMRRTFIDTASGVVGDRIILAPTSVTSILPIDDDTDEARVTGAGADGTTLVATGDWCGHPVQLFRLACDLPDGAWEEDENDEYEAAHTRFENALKLISLAASIAYAPSLLQMHGLVLLEDPPYMTDAAKDKPRRSDLGRTSAPKANHGWYIVAEGGVLPLPQVCTEGFPLVAKLRVAQSLVGALAVLDAHGVPHWTWCARNVYVTMDGHAKLGGLWDAPRVGDAEVARYQAPEDMDETRDAASLEVESPNAHWFAALVYAFGVTLWEMIMAYDHGVEVFERPLPLCESALPQRIIQINPEELFDCLSRQAAALGQVMTEDEIRLLVNVIDSCVNPSPMGRLTVRDLVSTMTKIVRRVERRFLANPPAGMMPKILTMAAMPPSSDADLSAPAATAAAAANPTPPTKSTAPTSAATTATVGSTPPSIVNGSVRGVPPRIESAMHSSPANSTGAVVITPSNSGDLVARGLGSDSMPSLTLYQADTTGVMQAELVPQDGSVRSRQSLLDKKHAAAARHRPLPSTAGLTLQSPPTTTMAPRPIMPDFPGSFPAAPTYPAATAPSSGTVSPDSSDIERPDTPPASSPLLLTQALGTADEPSHVTGKINYAATTPSARVRFNLSMNAANADKKSDTVRSTGPTRSILKLDPEAAAAKAAEVAAAEAQRRREEEVHKARVAAAVMAISEPPTKTPDPPVAVEKGKKKRILSRLADRLSFTKAPSTPSLSDWGPLSFAKSEHETSPRKGGKKSKKSSATPAPAPVMASPASSAATPASSAATPGTAPATPFTSPNVMATSKLASPPMATSKLPSPPMAPAPMASDQPDRSSSPEPEYHSASESDFPARPMSSAADDEDASAASASASASAAVETSPPSRAFASSPPPRHASPQAGADLERAAKAHFDAGDGAEATRLLARAASVYGRPTAMMLLGDWFYYGEKGAATGTRDLERAKLFYAQAVDLGHTVARAGLADLIMFGSGHGLPPLPSQVEAALEHYVAVLQTFQAPPTVSRDGDADEDDADDAAFPAPLLARVHAGIADALALRGDMEQAEDYARVALDIDPKTRRAAARLGKCIVERAARETERGGPPAVVDALLNDAWVMLQGAQGTRTGLEALVEWYNVRGDHDEAARLRGHLHVYSDM